MENQMESFSPDTTSQETSSAPQGEQLPSIADLDKMDRFKFDGREMTREELKSSYLRQQDYTRKTQELAEQRRAFEQDRKFYENLNADLRMVQQNPALANEFIKIYPQRFHSALRDVLNGGQPASTQQTQQQNRGPDVDMMSRMANLEKFYHDQEVSKNETQINGTIDKMSSKYPDAIPELVIGRVFEAYTQMLKNDPQAKLTSQMWEDTFKSVDSFMKDRVNTMYKSKQQEQLKANKRSGDVSAGGGTVGRAPQKFKDLKSVTEFAVRDLTGRS